MRRKVLRFLVILLAVLRSFAAAQQMKVVRVGVVVQQPTAVVNWTPNARWQRDLLVNYLNHHESAQDSHLKLEAVPLTTTFYGNINSEAREKRCDYIVRVWIPGPVFHGPENFFDGRARSLQPDFGNAFQTESGLPDYPVSYSVGYMLERVRDGEEFGGESFTQIQPQPATATMTIANSVHDAIMKAAP